MVKIAATADIHVRETDSGKRRDFFERVSENADVLLICGDLTDTGRPEEAEILASELEACSIPVVGVLGNRSEEHTSELQSRENLVCRLLLEKKKTRTKQQTQT